MERPGPLFALFGSTAVFRRVKASLPRNTVLSNETLSLASLTERGAVRGHSPEEHRKHYAGNDPH